MLLPQQSATSWGITRGGAKASHEVVSICSIPAAIKDNMSLYLWNCKVYWWVMWVWIIHTRLHCLKSALTPIIADSIRDVFKQVLRRELGRNWYQLATAMGLPKTDIDDIQDQPGIPLSCKIDTFLVNYQFPSFANDRETAEFLVEALERASLPYIAAAVSRNMECALQREGTQFSVCTPSLSFHSSSSYMSCFSVLC